MFTLYKRWGGFLLYLAKKGLTYISGKTLMAIFEVDKDKQKDFISYLFTRTNVEE